jgi:hypothetical protein
MASGFQQNAFQDSAFQVGAVVSVRKGGIGKKYPKRVTVDGRVYTVRSREEELALLRRLTEQANDQAAIAKGLGDEVLARRIIKKAERLEKKVDERAILLQRLVRDDEEILLLLSA